MSILTDSNEPGDRSELDHAGRAADHLLALVVARDPEIEPTPELHDACAALVVAFAAALTAAGGAR
jgi:hypothetical protein